MTDLVGFRRLNGHPDGFPGIGTDLEFFVCKITGKQFLVVE